MKNNPLVSVIVPIYNLEKYLEKSIPSILKQTYRNIEILLVDDGSKDNSLAICSSFQTKDSRVKVFSQKNQGAGPARNLGIEKANGKYLYFFDADDYLRESALETIVEEMENDPADLLYFGTTTDFYTKEDDEILESKEDQLPSLKLDSQEKCRKYWTMLSKIVDTGSPWNKLYQKEIIDKYHLRYPNLRRMQDVVFNLYYYDCITSLRIVPTNLYVRTWHSMATERKKIPPTLMECVTTYHKTATELNQKWGTYDDDTRRYLTESFASNIGTALFFFLPADNPTFSQTFKHVKSIVNNPYVTSVYKEAATFQKERKLDWCIRHRWNLLIALFIALKNKD